MKTRFWTIILLMVAYSIPIVAAFTIDREVEAFGGLFCLFVNFAIYAFVYNDRVRSDEAVMFNSLMLIVLGILFAVVISLVASVGWVWLTIAMFIVSAILFAVFDKK